MKKTLCSSYVLITKKDDLASIFYTVASTLNIEEAVTVVSEIPEDVSRFDVIVCDVGIAKKRALPERTIIILFDEKLGNLLDRFDGFIYNVYDPLKREIFMSFYMPVSRRSINVDEYTPEDKDVEFTVAEFDFKANFFKGIFFCNGHEIYLTKGERKYLYLCMVTHNAPGKDRYILCKLKKRLRALYARQG